MVVAGLRSPPLRHAPTPSAPPRRRNGEEVVPAPRNRRHRVPLRPGPKRERFGQRAFSSLAQRDATAQRLAGSGPFAEFLNTPASCITSRRNLHTPCIPRHRLVLRIQGPSRCAQRRERRPCGVWVIVTRCEEDAHLPIAPESPVFMGRASPFARDLCNVRVQPSFLLARGRYEGHRGVGLGRAKCERPYQTSPWLPRSPSVRDHRDRSSPLPARGPEDTFLWSTVFRRAGVSPRPAERGPGRPQSPSGTLAPCSARKGSSRRFVRRGRRRDRSRATANRGRLRSCSETDRSMRPRREALPW